MTTHTHHNRASNMYPFSGGIAGKLGDRFEAKWAIMKLFEVMLGHADSMLFEFVDPLNHGAEFWLIRNGHKEWYQAKRQNTQGNWTIGRLAREGVLTTALAKLSAEPNDTFHFLSTAPATELHQLSQRAASIETNISDFLSSLSSEERASHLPELCRHWRTTEEQAWRCLQRIQVVCEPEPDLDRNIEMFGGLLFRDGYRCFFPILREYLENCFNRELTTEITRNEIICNGLLAPRMPLDPTVRENIKLANQRYLESYAPFGIGGEIISRNEAQQALAALADADGPAIILLTGNAGTGKSGVIREILSELEMNGSTFLAFRADNRLGSDSATALGQSLYGRSENPLNTLQSLAPDGKAVLFIDQIDAISEVSGRTGAIREVIFEFLDYARMSKNIRIIAACRTYDLSNDSALLKLEKMLRVQRIEIKLLDWATEIEPLFTARGISCDSISSKQRQLLTLPLNLALFLEVYEQNEMALLFQSTTELFDRLVEKKQRAIVSRGFPDFGIMVVLSHLAQVMSNDQSLDASITVLDHFPHAVDLLATEHLISRVDGRINFFHESLFDYAFARGFVSKRRNLLDFLRADEQALFRRTQVRQILTMYRQTAQAAYLRQLAELLNSPAVRYHLKDAIMRWLGGLDQMSEAELDVVLTLDTPKEQMPPLVRMAIHPQVALLPILLRRGLIARWLTASSEGRRNDTLNILRNGAKLFPAESAQALRTWWSGDAARGQLLLGWFSWLHEMPPSPDLLDLNVDLIRSKPEGLLERAGLYDRHSMSAWLKHDPVAAGTLLRTWFEVWYDTFPEGHPFERGEQSDLDYHWLGELQKKSSVIFLEATIPAFIEAIRRINLTFDGHTWTDYTWLTHYDRGSFGPDRFIALLLNAFRTVVTSVPEQATIWFERIQSISHPATLYLCLEIIGSSGEAFAQRLVNLITEEKLFDVGPNAAEWLSFVRAANTALPFITAHERERIEQRILSHWPELRIAKKLAHDFAAGQPEVEPFWTHKSVISDLNWSGYKQWCILKSLDTSTLSSKALQRLNQLDKKFRDKSIPKPNNLEVTCVPPPIGSERAKFMSDNAWLSAFNAYCDDRETSRKRGEWFHHTGASGLAQILQERTKEEPERFMRLLQRMPTNTNQEYFNGIVNGLSESRATDELLVEALRHVHDLPGRPCCEGVCRILQKRPTLAAHNEVFAMLIWYVEHGEADTNEETDQKRTQELTVSAEQLIRRGGFTMHRSGYFDRGTAVETLGDVLWENDTRLLECVDLINRCIENETLESICCMLTKPIYSVLRQDNRLAATLLKQLINRKQGLDLTPLATYKGVLLLKYILHGTPDIGMELLEQLLLSDSEEYRRLGAFHLFREAFYNEALAERAKALLDSGDIYRKIAASLASHHLAHAAYRQIAEQQLMAFFNDPDKEVRTDAAECFRELWNESVESYRPLLRAFIQSTAFTENTFSFFHFLNDLHEPVTEEVLLSAERILEIIEQQDDSSSGKPYREMHYLDELLLKEYTSTEYRPVLRGRILDIIDRMLILGLYGTDKIVQEHERM
ncbi:ATP-binding protein [Trichlorobacter lovleyi]|uniref:ATP-binding protein n=1 Tax=Trichlorobacter lovleyi TaxID=313985 RepID=UPI0023F39594|nr:ATP-binding protein [Trichlorobacter lovleyi]